MFMKNFTSISFATLASLGALALSVESASARPGGGYRGSFHGGGGIHRGFVRHGGFRHGHWGHQHHRYGWGVYAAPLLVSAATYVPECYYVRRFGTLYKVCN
jgi:hypothetical protein